MKNKLLYITIAFLTIVIIYISVNDKSNNYFNKIELSNTSFIVNRTNMHFLDTVISVGLDELNVKGVTVLIRPLKNKTLEGTDLILKAKIIGNGSQFVLYIDKDSKNEMIESIAHELIHLKQLNSGKLILYNTFVIFDGKKYGPETPYIERPWELEAFYLEKELSKIIKNILY